MRHTIAAALAGALLTLPALAHEPVAGVSSAPPDEPYRAVSELVAMPDFIPGLGQLFVDPDALPAGPFLSYDREGRLVATIYMIPLDELGPDSGFTDLAAPGGAVDHVEVHYNAGHPGLEMPHASARAFFSPMM